MTSSSIDYAASYVKYKPPPIQGTPTDKSLERLIAKLRANAGSVETDLGGENMDIWTSNSPMLSILR